MQANQVEVNQLDFISFEEEAVSESENEIEIVEKQKEITNETTAQTYKQTTQTYKQTAQSYQPTTQNYQAFHPIETLALAADSMDSLQEMMDQEDEYLSYDPLTPLPINPWVPSGRIYSKNMLTLYVILNLHLSFMNLHLSFMNGNFLPVLAWMKKFRILCNLLNQLLLNMQ